MSSQYGRRDETCPVSTGGRGGWGRASMISQLPSEVHLPWRNIADPSCSSCRRCSASLRVACRSLRLWKSLRTLGQSAQPRHPSGPRPARLQAPRDCRAARGGPCLVIGSVAQSLRAEDERPSTTERSG